MNTLHYFSSATKENSRWKILATEQNSRAYIGLAIGERVLIIRRGHVVDASLVPFCGLRLLSRFALDPFGLQVGSAAMNLSCGILVPFPLDTAGANSTDFCASISRDSGGATSTERRVG